ncbi:hypothetical protein GCM10007390_11240 [Persicitalea jodogahamensis]|uniref:Outer membrane protein beta-barrel domain-containing protein n=1 Tax=Persicitalea jodogahamensis TaxID=402147 RepID=A0A8J3D813_9BACT|nr:hypothetical protein GCM10007390_11240 [Persicitalea jodogahamensis]
MLSGSAFAQYQGPRRQKNLDAALAAGKGFSPALSFQSLYGGRFKIGWGVRYTGYFGKSTELVTAPAALTSGKTDPSVLFSENILSNFDTLTLNKVQSNALNAVINLQFSLSNRFEVGFNIDAIGLSFGAQQMGRFHSASESAALDNTVQTAKPTTFNLLLISDNDRGNLNSELYARYWVSDRMAVRAGLSFNFVEYTTDQKLTFDNDRFRYKSLLPMVAVSFTPFAK